MDIITHSQFPASTGTLTSMRRLLPLRLLLAVLSFAGLASDSALKVAHGEVHLTERLAFESVEADPGASAHAAGSGGGGGGEVHEAARDHSELHAVTVAPQLAAHIALPVYLTGVLPGADLAAESASPRTVASVARPPTFDGVPAQPRAPPIG